MQFEEQLQALQECVRKIESGQLSLEESLQFFEQGVKLVQGCQAQLKAAEMKVEQLTQAALEGRDTGSNPSSGS